MKKQKKYKTKYGKYPWFRRIRHVDSDYHWDVEASWALGVDGRHKHGICDIKLLGCY